jgi:cell division protein FtsB
MHHAVMYLSFLSYYPVLRQTYGWDYTERDRVMPSFVLLLLILLVFACAFGFMIYSDMKRRAREKKRNQYHDRV